MTEYDLDNPDDVIRMLRAVEAEGVRLMNEAEAEHLQKIMDAPIETDADYERISELADERE